MGRWSNTEIRARGVVSTSQGSSFGSSSGPAGGPPTRRHGEGRPVGLIENGAAGTRGATILAKG